MTEIFALLVRVLAPPLLQTDGSATTLTALALLAVLLAVARSAMVRLVLGRLSGALAVPVPSWFGRPMAEILSASATPSSRPRPRAPSSLPPVG